MKGSKVLPGGFMWMFVLLLVTASVSARRPGGSGSGGSGGSGGSTGGSGGSTGGSGGSTGGSGGSGGIGGGSTAGQQVSYPPSSGWSGTSYRPPSQIQHGSNSFPVSQTAPPTYVYQMRDSGSRYNNLVTGMMLWNFARPRPSTMNNNQVCRFRMSVNGTTEHRRVNCNSISSFIRDWENQGNNSGNSTFNINVPGTGNVTVIDDDDYDTNSTMDAMDDVGRSILVTPGMVCHILRTWNRRTTTQEVDCMVLQLYTASSWHRSGSDSVKLSIALLLIPIFQVLRFNIF